MHNTHALSFLLNTRQPDLFLFPDKSKQLFHPVILSSSAGHPSDPRISSSASPVCISSIQTYSFNLIIRAPVDITFYFPLFVRILLLFDELILFLFVLLCRQISQTT